MQRKDNAEMTETNEAVNTAHPPTSESAQAGIIGKDTSGSASFARRSSLVLSSYWPEADSGPQS